MRTSFHHQPEAQHPIFQLSTSWQADYPIFRGQKQKTFARLSLPLLNPEADDRGGSNQHPPSLNVKTARLWRA